MRKYLNRIAYLTVLAALFVGCDKEEPLPFYQNGSVPVFSSSVTTIAPAPSDSLKPVVVFSWTNPGYATDSSTVKYIIQIDSSGGDFSNAASFTVFGAKTDTLIAKDLNAILVGWGFSFGKSYDIQTRLLSSYANNNEQYASNVISLKVTPYLIPPKVTPPSTNELFLVGGATDSGWNNPVPVPTQQFARIDSVTYGGVFHLKANDQYLILPKNGDWTQKYAVPDNTVSGLAAGGSFGFFSNAWGNSNDGKNIPGPTVEGMYKIILDFQQGIFTVTPYTAVLPDSLFITGNAFTDAWANPVPASQKLTRINSCEFQLTTPLIGGQQYLLLPVNNGDWGHKFTVQDNTVPGLAEGGSFGYDLPGNFPGPADDGTYKLVFNFLDYTFMVAKQ